MLHNNPLKTKFMAKVDKNGPIHPVCGRCWIWIGRLARDGYGIIVIDRVDKRAHRVSYSLFVGKIPNGLGVLHKCDNRSCVNPNHLTVGTQQDNADDMTSKMRQAYGERNANAKLTDSVVAEIICLYKPRRRGLGTHALAKRFGISQATVHGIVTGVSWKHLQRGK